MKTPRHKRGGRATRRDRDGEGRRFQPRSQQPKRVPAHPAGGRSRPARAERRQASGQGRAEMAMPLASTQVQTVHVSADEAGMRVDRFLEARFPALSFSHIQRVIRKGELRVDGKRVDGKDRLKEGQTVRIPPVRLDAPKATPSAEAEEKTREFLRSITLFEDADVL